MTSTTTRVLVTGAGGFVMSVFIARLLDARPDVAVTALDVAPLDAPAEAFFAPYRDRIRFVRCDVTDRAALDAALRPVAADMLVHGATVTHVPAWELERPHGFLDVNVSGTLNVLEAARVTGPLSRVVHVSSAAVYGLGDPGKPPGLQREDQLFPPADYYGIGKLGGELVARRFAALHGIPTPVVRFTRVFGPMERPTGGRKVMHLPYTMMARMLRSKPVRITARSRASVGDWISAEDVAEALVALLASTTANGVYNIATGRPIAVPEILAAAPVAVEWVDDDASADADFDPDLRRGQFGVYDTAAIRGDLGWAPRPIEVQMASYIDWAQKNPSVFEAILEPAGP